MPTEKINDIEMYYEQKGKGQPLLMIAGLSSNHTIWDLMVDDLSKEFTVILPDNRDCGRTSQPAGSYTIEQMADDIANLMDKLGIDATYAVGHSMGGSILQQLCLKYPAKIRAAVFAGATANNPIVTKMKFIGTVELIKAGVEQGIIFDTVIPWLYSGSFLEQDNKIAEEKHRALHEEYPQSSEAYIAQATALKNFNSLDKLKNIKCPTLVIAGSDDILLPVKCSKIIAESIPNAKLEIIDDCGHMFPREKPSEFSRLIINFMKNCL